MSPNAYEAAKRLAADPRTPEHERESARARVREYEAAHPPRQAAPGPGSYGFTRAMYEDLLRNLGNIKFDAGFDAAADPFAFYGVPRQHPKAEPSRIVKPSAEDVQRYAPKAPPSRPRVRRATTAEVETYASPSKEPRP